MRQQNSLPLFCRLDSKESCDKTIEMLSGSSLPETSEPLMVKFADSSSNRKRQQTAGGCGPIEFELTENPPPLSSGRWRDIGEVAYTHVLYSAYHSVFSCSMYMTPHTCCLRMVWSALESCSKEC